MRIAVSGPPKWKSVQRYNQEEVTLVKEWLSIQLDIALMRGEVKGVTSLHLGLDTYFAALCESKGIHFKVFLSCKDQDKFWDEETKKTFKYLLDKAESIKYVSQDGYKPGCIGKQTEAITEWLAEEESTLLLIKYKGLSKAQLERKKNLEKDSKIAIYRMKR